jgi:hypothetical protein
VINRSHKHQRSTPVEYDSGQSSSAWQDPIRHPIIMIMPHSATHLQWVIMPAKVMKIEEKK